MKRLLLSVASLTTLATLVFSGCAAPANDSTHDEVSANPSAPASAGTASDEAQASPSPEETEAPAELIGGGDEIFPDRRFIALYGSPISPALGALGQQGPEESVTRVKELAEMYEKHTNEIVVPTFEVIATVASSSAQADGSYSAVTSPEELEPLLDVAEKNDVYVVLDLQPGHSDFLSQAKIYEDLLTRPNVGLALDPEWRLAPGQRHMQQIGSVSAAEINETADWLAELTAEHELPQKIFMIHQFRHSMIQNRGQMDTSHPELAVVLHADGHGTPGQKMETWNSLRQDLPEGVHMAWKNFFLQDQPMFSPKETFEIEPKPWFVSYQ